MKKLFITLLAFSLFAPLFGAEEKVEEVVVVGSQIKGAKITGATSICSDWYRH